MSYPLYDVLIKDIKDTELTTSEKLKLISIIPTLDQKEHDTIFTLIRIHGLKNNYSKNIFDIPYDGQNLNKNNTCQSIKFNVDKLPHIVGQIVFKFLTIHTEKMRENSE